MKVILGLLSVVLLGIFGLYLSGEFAGNSSNNGNNESSNEIESIEVKSDRAYSVVQDENLKVTSQVLTEIPSEITPTPNRVEYQDQQSDVEMNDTNYRDVADTKNKLMLIGEIYPPQIEGETLQASDVFITEKEGRKWLYVAYNMIGEPFLGAVQVVRLPEDSRRDAIEILQTVAFRDLDVHNITVANNILYLAGSTRPNASFKTPATLEIIKLQNGQIPSSYKSTRIDLPSFAAVSVVKVKNKVYVATGDRNGGIVEISNPGSLRNQVYSLNDISHQFYALEDARDLDYSDNFIFAIKGTNAALWRLNRESGEVLPLVDLNGATIPESKSTVQVSGDYLLLGLGDGGTQIYNINDQAVSHELAPVAHDYLDASLTVTNAVSGFPGEFYTADGEAGARVFQYDGTSAPRQLAQIEFGRGESVNAILYHNDYLIMASGMGGLKVVQIIRHEGNLKKNHDRYFQNLNKRRSREF